jgi:hypothetical protein
MKELLEKLSSYNIFNYLFPGILFVVFAQEFTSYVYIKDNVLQGLITFYFIGFVVSRFGSLIIEPFLKKIKFISFSNYEDFIDASKKDEKITLLSEQNNMLRSLISMFFLLLIFKGYDLLSNEIPFLNKWGLLILLILLIILFIFSYKKQVQYIKNRIQHQVEKNGHH